jgi:outer membrane biosynthesis protein TonB
MRRTSIMTRTIKFKLFADIPENYQPLPQAEKRRIIRLVSKKLLSQIKGYDGVVSVTVTINTKGNI